MVKKKTCSSGDSVITSTVCTPEINDHLSQIRNLKRNMVTVPKNSKSITGRLTSLCTAFATNIGDHHWDSWGYSTKKRQNFFLKKRFPKFFKLKFLPASLSTCSFDFLRALRTAKGSTSRFTQHGQNLQQLPPFNLVGQQVTKKFHFYN